MHNFIFFFVLGQLLITQVESERVQLLRMHNRALLQLFQQHLRHAIIAAAAWVGFRTVTRLLGVLSAIMAAIRLVTARGMP